MKRIVDGKMYNTETATKIHTEDACLSSTDFRHWNETLYKTKKGAYFLAGYGGPMTRWAVPSGDGNGRCGSKGIRVLSEADARYWVEKYANDKYEEVFGAAQEA
jgi:hypothetical protein